MNPYPSEIANTVQGVADVVRHISRERQSDIKDFDNLQSRFMSGRKVGKVPSGSSDVDATDRLGDFNYDADYLYILVDDSGAVWRRITLESW